MPATTSGGPTDYEQLRQNPSQFVENILGPEPFDYQQTFLDADERHRVIASGRQVGKSRMCAWLALHRAVTRAHSLILITAPSLRQSSLLFSTLYSEIDQSGLSNDEWGIDRDTQTIIEFDNGSKIHCVPTGEDGTNVRGYTADVIIVDEAAFVDDSIFEDILYPMTFATSGEFVLASTPYGQSGFFYEKHDAADHSDRWHASQVDSYQNPLTDEQDLEEWKQGKTDVQVKREIQGQFDETGNTFFPMEKVRACTATGKLNQQGSQAWLGADIGGSGADPTVLYGIDETGNVFLHDEVYEDMGPLGAADRIGSLDSLYDFERIYVDRTAIGEGAVEKLTSDTNVARKVEDIYFTLQKKQQLFQRLKAALEAESVTLPNRRVIRNQLERIEPSRTANDNLRLQPKNDGHDDHVDALALACWGLPGFGDNTQNNGGAKTAVTTQQRPRSVTRSDAMNKRRPSDTSSSQRTQTRTRRRRRIKRR